MVCDLSQNNLKDHLQNYANAIIERLSKTPNFSAQEVAYEIYKSIFKAKGDIKQALSIAYHVPQITYDLIKNNPQISEKELTKKGYDSTALLAKINELEASTDKIQAIANYLNVTVDSVTELLRINAEQPSNDDVIIIKATESEVLKMASAVYSASALNSTGVTEEETKGAEGEESARSLDKRKEDEIFYQDTLVKILGARTDNDVPFDKVKYGDHTGFKGVVMYEVDIKKESTIKANRDSFIQTPGGKTILIPQIAIGDTKGNLLYFKPDGTIGNKTNGKVVYFTLQSASPANQKALYEIKKAALKPEDWTEANLKAIKEQVNEEYEVLNGILNSLSTSSKVIVDITKINPGTIKIFDEAKGLQRSEVRSQVSDYNLTPKEANGITLLPVTLEQNGLKYRAELPHLIFDDSGRASDLFNSFKIGQQDPELLDHIIDVLFNTIEGKTNDQRLAYIKQFINVMHGDEHIKESERYKIGINSKTNGLFLYINGIGKPLTKENREFVKEFLGKAATIHFDVKSYAKNEYEKYNLDVAKDGTVKIIKEEKIPYQPFIFPKFTTRFIMDKTSKRPMSVNGYISFDKAKTTTEVKAEVVTTTEKVKEANVPLTQEEDDLNFEDLKRSKLIENIATPQQKEKAEKWWKNSVFSKAVDSTGKPLFTLSDMRNVVNSDAWATYRNSIITLYEGSDFTHGYHEAWHAFSQVFLTKNERTSLYDKIGDLEGTFSVVRNLPGTTEVTLENVKFSEATRLEKEEFIAEEFRKYAMNNGKFKGAQTKKKNIFARIFDRVWKALQNLMGTNSDVYSAPGTQPVLETIFNQLYTAKSQKDLLPYSPNVDNAEFGLLNSGGIIFEDPNDSLTESEALLLTRTIDGIISEQVTKQVQVKNNYGTVSLIFSSPDNLTSIYNLAKVRLNNKRIEYLNQLNEIQAEPDSPLKAAEVSILENKIQLLSKAVKDEVFGDVKNVLLNKDASPSLVGFHRTNSAFSDMFVKLKEKEVIVSEEGEVESEKEEEEDLEGDESKDLKEKGGDFSNSSVSSEKLADDLVLYLVKSLLKQKANGEIELNDLGFAEPIEFLPFWRVLVDKVSGETTVLGLYENINKASKLSPLFSQLLSKIYVQQLNEDKSAASPEESLTTMFKHSTEIGKIWMKMVQSLNLHKTELIANTITVEKGKTEIRVGKTSAAYHNIKNKVWPNQFEKKEVGGFVTKDADGINIVDIDKVVKTYIRSENNLKGETTYYIDGDNKINYVPFLNSIGLYVSNIPQIVKALSANDVNYIAKSLYLLNEHNKNFPDKKINISDAADFFSKERKLSKDVTLVANDGAVNRIAEYEATYSLEYSSSMKLTPTNDLKSTVALNSSDTQQIKALNKANNFNDLLSDAPEMVHMNRLNPLSNPAVRGLITIKSMFAKTGESLNNEAAYVDLTGTSYVNKNENEYGSKGITHVKMGYLDTILSNFISTLGGGYMKSITPGDKSSYLAFKLDHINTYLGKQNPNLYIDTFEFFKEGDNFIMGSDPMYKILDMLYPKLEGEIRRIAMVEADKLLPIEKQWYSKLTGFKNADKFDIFDEILQPQTKKLLLKSKIISKLTKEGKDLVEILNADAKLKSEVVKDIKNFFDALEKSYTEKLFDPIFGEGKPMPEALRELALADLIKKDPLKVVGLGVNKEAVDMNIKQGAIKSYMFNNFIHKTETTVLFQGDGFQFDHSKDEITKRTSGSQSGGSVFPVDALTKIYIDKMKGRAYEEKLIEQGLKKKKGLENVREYGPTLNSAILAESKVASTYFDMYRDLFKKDFEKRIKDEDGVNAALYGVDSKTGKIGSAARDSNGKYIDIYDGGKMKPFINIEDGDGQGWITFDTYRILKLAEGTWTNEQDALWMKILNEEEVSASDISEMFPVYKLQYNGALATEVGRIPVMAFHKFSLFPLIPSVIKGLPAETMHKAMIAQNIDYALFKSGSKRSSINATDNNVGDKIYTGDTSNIKSFNDIEFTPNPIYISFLKNQTVVNAYFKDESTFSSQLRKLITTGMYENGVPVDFIEKHGFTNKEDAISAWNKVVDKRGESLFHEYAERLTDSIADFVEYKKKELLDELGWTEADLDIVDVSPAKMASMFTFLDKELKKQGFSEHERALLKGDATNTDLSNSPLAARFEKVILAIVNNRIVKSKLKGEALVELSSAFMQNDKFRMPTDEEKAKYDDFGTNGLSSYIVDINGKEKTIGFKFKRALRPMDENLFKLNYFVKDDNGNYVKSDKTIEVRKNNVVDFEASLDRLNEMLRVDAWLQHDDNYKKIRLTGVRIPTQGHNSMEFGQVAEFLRPSAGSVIIIPAEIVAKSGTDFDVDKMTTYSPSLTSSGKLMQKFTEEEHKERVLKAKTLYKTLLAEKNKTQLKEDIKNAKAQVSNKWYLIQPDLGRFRNAIEKDAKRLKNVNEALLKKLTTKKNRNLIATLNDPEIQSTLKALFPRANAIYEKELKGASIEDLENSEKELNALFAEKDELYHASIAFQDALDEQDYPLGGIQNELIENMTNILSLPQLAVSLLSPNDTNLAKPISDEIKKAISTTDDELDFTKSIVTGKKLHDKGISPTKAYTETYNTKKQIENTSSKDSLGIAAVDNYINILLNRSGAKLRKTVTVNAKVNISKTNVPNYKPRGVTVPIDLRLNHNKIDGAISLSNILDANRVISIADVINQLMNGFVDAGKEAWVVYLQGNPEVVPKFLFLLEAGVPIEEAAYFLSNPITRDYIKEKAKRNSVLNFLVDDSGKTAYDTTGDFLKKLNLPFALKEMLSKNGGNIYTYSEIINSISYKNDFKLASLKNIVKSKANYDNNAQIAGFLEYLYIEEIVADYDEMKKVMNPDTKKTPDLYTAQSKTKALGDVRNSKIIDTDSIDGVFNESIISPYYIQEFTRKLFSRVFKLRDSSIVNRFLLDTFSEIKNKAAAKRVTGYVNEVYISKFKNFIAQYIFANELRRYNPLTKDYTTINGKKLNKPQEFFDKVNADYDNGVYLDTYTGPNSYYSRGIAPISPNAFPVLEKGKVNEDLRTDFIEFVLEREQLEENIKLEDVVNSKEFILRKQRLINSGKELYQNRTEEQINQLTYSDMLTNKALTNTYNIWQLFRSGDNTIAKELMDIITNYPELSESVKYSILKQFTSKGIPNYKELRNVLNFKLNNSGELDEALISDYNTQWNNLANVGEFKVVGDDIEAARANAYISKFFENLPVYAFLQSGMDSSEFSLSSVMPYTKYQRIIEEASAKFLKKLETEDSTKLLTGLKALFENVNKLSSKKLRNRGANLKQMPINLKGSAYSIYEQPFIKASTKVPGVFLIESTYEENGILKSVTKEKIEELIQSNKTTKFILSNIDLVDATKKQYTVDEIKDKVKEAVLEIKENGFDVVIFQEGVGHDPIAFYTKKPDQAITDFVDVQKVEGVDISSYSTNELGAALTNPTEKSKKNGNITSSYPVKIKGKTYVDAETAYQALKDTSEATTKPAKEDSKNYKLMVDIITAKLQQHPVLAEGINMYGGSEFILKSIHQPTKKDTVWETKGKNWFISALNDAYLNVAKTENNPNEYINHSGGAYGGDTFWDIIGREFGVTKHMHYKDAGNANLSQKLRNAGVKATILTKEQMDNARTQVEKLLGEKYPDTLQGNLQVRNYYQVANADAVYAVAQLADDKGKAIKNYLYPTIKGVTGGTNTAVQLAIKLNKPVYVWDLGLKTWFKWNGKYFTATDTPTLTKNFAGIGSRDIESYNIQKDGKWVPRTQYKGIEVENAAKQAIRDVYENTFKVTQSSTNVKREYTPENITSLKSNEVFVFGSNAEGAHGKGAALLAKQKFGAIQGQSEGLQGQSYAIITKKDWRVEKSSTLNEIANGIMKFVSFASNHPDKKFYVTKIGSSLAGYTIEEIKDVWKQVNTVWENDIFDDIPSNIILPKEYEMRNTPTQPQATVSILPTDRIIFGHPSIGKSYLKGKGEDRFISLDDDYKKEINRAVEQIAKTYNVTTYQVKDGGNQEWNKAYNSMMQDLFNNAKQEAISKNKTLFTSNTNLLKTNIESFDKVINIPDEEFYKRIKERGEKYDTKQWKAQINEAISKVSSNKVIITDKYLSDLLPKEPAILSDKEPIQEVSKTLTGKMYKIYENEAREGVVSKSTFDAIKNGERTATTRYESEGKINYWKTAKVGDIIQWESATGEKILTRVTKPLHKLKGSGKTVREWSQLEGWSIDHFNKKVMPKIDEAWQIEYEYIPSNSVELTPAEETIMADDSLKNFIAEQLNESFGLNLPVTEPARLISDEEIAKFKAVVDKTKAYPKEYFTNNGVSKWILNSSNLYDLIDQDSQSMLLKNFSFILGSVAAKAPTETPVNEQYRAKKLAEIRGAEKNGLGELLATKSKNINKIISNLEAASTQEEVNDIINDLTKLIC